MDLRLVDWVNGAAARHDTFEDVVGRVGGIAVFILIGLLALTLIPWGRWRFADGLRAMAGTGVATLLALGIAQLISGAADRPRPFVAHPGSVHIFAPHVRDPSMPSDHATASFAIAVSLLIRRTRFAPLALLAAIVISASRVVLGLHYPTDVLAGALLGSLCAVLVNSGPPKRIVDRISDRVAALLEAARSRIAQGTGVTGGGAQSPRSTRLLGP
jgi:undecaprenyl-diphosphatase